MFWARTGGFFPRGGGTDIRTGLSGVTFDETSHGGIVAFPIVEVSQQEMMLAAGFGAKGDKIAGVQFQIGPTAGDDVMKGKFVMDVHFGGFIASGTLGMRGAKGAFDLIPRRAARDAGLLEDGTGTGEMRQVHELSEFARMPAMIVGGFGFGKFRRDGHGCLVQKFVAAPHRLADGAFAEIKCPDGFSVHHK